MLLVLTLGVPGTKAPPGQALTSIDIRAEQKAAEPTPDDADTRAEAKPQDQRPAESKLEMMQQTERQPTEPAAVIPTIMSVPKFDLSKTPPRRPQPPAPSSSMMGPPVPRSATPDSERVAGAGPNGEPLYKAAWYREPLDIELRGYLSTASGPGWGMIACRTAPNYRVEDCFAIDEYPENSNINRSILAAAWQFQVRPPRIGGRYMVGEWVRIRIDYHT